MKIVFGTVGSCLLYFKHGGSIFLLNTYFVVSFLLAF